MATVHQLRTRFGIAVGLLLAVDVAAAAMYFSPIASPSKRSDESRVVHKQFQEKAHVYLPLQNIDKKLNEAKEQTAAFNKDRLPTRDSAVVEEIGRQAQQAGVLFGNVRYGKPEDTPLPGVNKVEINVSLVGDYLKIVKFINALERDKTFFIVDSVNLAEQQGGTVRLELKIETYLRQGQA
jgi:type IV pilus assembly protein PilO